VAGTFANANVGTAKTVTMSGLTLGGASAANYTLIQPTTTASITAKALTVSGLSAVNKVYDGSTAASLTGIGALVGVVSGDTVALNGSVAGTFANANVGTAKTVTISGLTLGGTAAANYTLTQPTTTASITPKALTVSGIIAVNKVYDGTTTATLNTEGAALVGVVSGDTVTLNTSGAVAVFSDANLGTGKTVTISGLTLGGTAAANYTLIQPTATANIVVGGLDHLVLAPLTAAIDAGGSQAYTATGFDAFGNSLGNVTASTTFAIASGGSCTGAVCTSTILGNHTVTGAIGSAQGTATLHVNAVISGGTSSTYHAVTPARVLDSRISLGGVLFHSQVKQTVLIATAASGVPTTAVAITGNVTAVSGTQQGYVTVAPSLTSGVRPPTSTINFPTGDIRANGVTVALATGGKLDFMYWATNTVSTTQVVFDVTGYFTANTSGATYHKVAPVRVLDSRSSLGGVLFHSQVKQTVTIATTASHVPTTAVAVTGTVTVTGQTQEGYVTVAPSLTSGVRPPTSTINFPLGDTRSNGITVALATGGKLAFMYWGTLTTSTVSVIFDVTGYYTADATGASYHTLTPVRVLDSRIPLGGVLFHSQVKQTVTVATVASGVPTNAIAISGNVTVVDMTQAGYVTVAPSLTSGVRPPTTTINFPLGDIRANETTISLATGGKLDLMFWGTSTSATTNVILDVTGYFS
jgi:hypothetical protein